MEITTTKSLVEAELEKRGYSIDSSKPIIQYGYKFRIHAQRLQAGEGDFSDVIAQAFRVITNTNFKESHVIGIRNKINNIGYEEKHFASENLDENELPYLDSFENLLIKWDLPVCY